MKKKTKRTSRKAKSSSSIKTNCYRLGKSAVACVRQPAHTCPAWQEVTLFVLIALSYFLLKGFADTFFAPIISVNPFGDPILILEPFIFILLALLLVQKFWKSAILGFILSLIICLTTICFIVAIVALMSLKSEDILNYFSIVILPITIFSIAVSMGKKYQNGIVCV
jgi:hypothetical protein